MRKTYVKRIFAGFLAVALAFGQIPAIPANAMASSYIEADDEGNRSKGTAENIGTVGGQGANADIEFGGTLSKSTDADWYSFTAGMDGIMELSYSVSDVSSGTVEVTFPDGSKASEMEGSLRMTVKKGTSYTMGVKARSAKGTDGSLPYYQAGLRITPCQTGGSSGGEIEAGVPYYGSVPAGSGTKVDSWTFTAKESLTGKVEASMEDGNGNISLSVLVDGEEKGKTKTGSRTELDFGPVKKGAQVSFLVTGTKGESSGIYSISFETSPYESTGKQIEPFSSEPEKADLIAGNYDAAALKEGEYEGFLAGSRTPAWHVIRMDSDGILNVSAEGTGDSMLAIKELASNPGKSSSGEDFLSGKYDAKQYSMQSAASRSMSPSASVSIPVKKGRYYTAGILNSGQSGTYRLILTLDRCTSETEDNGQKGSASELSTGTEVHGTMRTASDKDYYRFEASKSGRATVTLTSKSPSAKYSLSAYSGNTKTVSKDMDVQASNSISIQFGIKAGESYEILTTPYYGIMAGDGYMISVKEEEEGQETDDITLGGAEQIMLQETQYSKFDCLDGNVQPSILSGKSYGSRLFGTGYALYQAENNGYLRFSLSGSGSYRFTVQELQNSSGTPAEGTVSAAKSSWKEVFSAQHTDQDILSYRIPVALGRFYQVKLEGEGSAMFGILSYQGTYETEDNGARTGANSFGERIYGTSSSASDRDFFVFEAEKTGKAEITFESGISGYSLKASCEGADLYSKTIGKTGSASFSVMEGASYYIEVIPPSGIASVIGNGYSLIRKITGDSGTSATAEKLSGEASARDFSTCIKSGAYAATGKRYTGSFSKGQSSNWYCFQSDKTGYLTMTTESGSGYVLTVNEYQSKQGQPTDEEDIIAGNFDQTAFSSVKVYEAAVPENAGEQRTYRIPVRKGRFYNTCLSKGTNGAVYYIMAETEPGNPETENNGAQGSASLVMGDRASGTMQGTSDVDFFKYIPEYSGKLSVSLTAGGKYSKYTLSLMNGSSVEAEESMSQQSVQSVSVQSYVIKGKPYYVRVKSYNSAVSAGDSYAIDFQVKEGDYESGGSTATARDPLATDLIYEGSVTTRHAADYWAVAVPEDGYLEISMESQENLSLDVLRGTSKDGSYSGNKIKTAKIPVRKDAVININISGKNTEAEYFLEAKMTKSSSWESGSSSQSNPDVMEQEQEIRGTSSPAGYSDHYLYKAEENGKLDLEFSGTFTKLSVTNRTHGTKYYSGTGGTDPKVRDILLMQGDEIYINAVMNAAEPQEYGIRSSFTKLERVEDVGASATQIADYTTIRTYNNGMNIGTQAFLNGAYVRVTASGYEAAARPDYVSYYGMSDSGSDSDTYTIKPSISGRMTVKVAPEGKYNVKITKGSTILLNDRPDGETDPIFAEAGQEYSITLTPSGASAGTVYEIGCMVTEDTSFIDNDTVSSVRTEAGTWYGYFTGSTDTDTFEWSVDKNGIAVFTAGSGMFGQVTIYAKGKGSSLERTVFSGKGSGASVRVPASAGTEFRAVLKGTGKSAYSFTIGTENSSEWEAEDFNDGEQELKNDMKGTVSYSGDSDYWIYEPDKDGLCTARIELHGNTGASIAITDKETGKTVYSATGKTGSMESCGIPVTKGRKLRIRIYGSNITEYEISVSTTDGGGKVEKEDYSSEMTDAGMSIQGDARYYGTYTYSGDEDYYIYKAEESGYVIIKASCLGSGGMSISASKPEVDEVNWMVPTSAVLNNMILSYTTFASSFTSGKAPVKKGEYIRIALSRGSGTKSGVAYTVETIFSTDPNFESGTDSPDGMSILSGKEYSAAYDKQGSLDRFVLDPDVGGYATVTVLPEKGSSGKDVSMSYFIKDRGTETLSGGIGSGTLLLSGKVDSTMLESEATSARFPVMAGRQICIEAGNGSLLNMGYRIRVDVTEDPEFETESYNGEVHTIGNAVRGTLTYSGDKDYFVYQAKSSGYAVLDANMEGKLSAFYGEKDSYGDDITGEKAIFSGYSPDQASAFKIPIREGTRIIIEASPSGNRGTEYDLSIKESSVPKMESGQSTKEHPDEILGVYPYNAYNTYKEGEGLFMEGCPSGYSPYTKYIFAKSDGTSYNGSTQGWDLAGSDMTWFLSENPVKNGRFSSKAFYKGIFSECNGYADYFMYEVKGSGRYVLHYNLGNTDASVLISNLTKEQAGAKDANLYSGDGLSGIGATAEDPQDGIPAHEGEKILICIKGKSQAAGMPYWFWIEQVTSEDIAGYEDTTDLGTLVPVRIGDGTEQFRFLPGDSGEADVADSKNGWSVVMGNENPIPDSSTGIKSIRAKSAGSKSSQSYEFKAERDGMAYLLYSGSETQGMDISIVDSSEPSIPLLTQSIKGTSWTNSITAKAGHTYIVSASSTGGTWEYTISGVIVVDTIGKYLDMDYGTYDKSTQTFSHGNECVLYGYHNGAKDEDSYKFTSGVTGYAHIEFISDGSGAKAEILSQLSSTSVSNAGAAGTIAAGGGSYVPLLRNDSILLKVSSSGSGNYSIRIKTFSANGWELETFQSSSDTKIKDLGTLSDGGLIYGYGTQSYSSDVDWFSFTAGAAGKYKLSLSLASASLSLYKDKAASTIKEEDGGWYMLSAGKYYVKLSGIRQTGSYYVLNLSSLGTTSAINSSKMDGMTYSNAITINAGQTGDYLDVILKKGCTYWFRYKHSSGRLTLFLKAPADGQMSFTAYDGSPNDNERICASGTVQAGKEASSGSIPPDEDNDIYICLSGYSGTGTATAKLLLNRETMSSTEFERNGTKANANDLTPKAGKNAENQGTISWASDEDYYVVETSSLDGNSRGFLSFTVAAESKNSGTVSYRLMRHTTKDTLLYEGSLTKGKADTFYAASAIGGEDCVYYIIVTGTMRHDAYTVTAAHTVDLKYESEKGNNSIDDTNVIKGGKSEKAYTWRGVTEVNLSTKSEGNDWFLVTMNQDGYFKAAIKMIDSGSTDVVEVDLYKATINSSGTAKKGDAVVEKKTAKSTSLTDICTRQEVKAGDVFAIHVTGKISGHRYEIVTANIMASHIKVPTISVTDAGKATVTWTQSVSSTTYSTKVDSEAYTDEKAIPSTKKATFSAKTSYRDGKEHKFSVKTIFVYNGITFSSTKTATKKLTKSS